MSNNLPLADNNEKILKDITDLQKIEKDLFDTLAQYPNLPSAKKNAIITKIDSISKMRLDLYSTLSNVNGYFQKALKNSGDTLNEQIIATRIVDNELRDSRTNLSLLEEEKNNKIRLIEINNFYGDKYADHTTLMKYIMFMLITIIICLVLFNKNIISNSVFYFLLIIISSIGGYFILKKILSIWNRDNMNYQEFNWKFNPDTAPTPVTNLNAPDPWTSITLCPKTENPPPTEETFVVASNAYQY
jgi:hypothetical protein